MVTARTLFRLAALAVGLFAASRDLAVGQVQQLGDLASRLEKEIKPVKPRLVAVVDFRPPLGTTMPQGHYFAWLLSTILEAQSKKKFVVADHREFDADLARLNLTPEVLSQHDSLRAAAPQIGANLLITGTIEKRDNSYFLQITPLRVSDAQALASLSVTIPISDFLESMLTPLPTNVLRFKGRPTSGYTMPSCIHCPDPSYTDPARQAKINGVAIFEVLISPEGRAAQVRPVKMLGYAARRESV